MHAPQSVTEGSEDKIPSSNQRDGKERRAVEMCVHPGDVIKVLIAITLALFAAHVLGLILSYNTDYEIFRKLSGLFHFGYEWNVPSVFSSSLLLICSIGTFLIWSLERSRKMNALWILLSVIFLFLAADELTSIHENFDTPVRNIIGASGVFYFSWIIPYMIAVIALSILYFRWLFSLPKPVRNIMIASAAIYLSGAVGVEMLEARHMNNHINDQGRFVWDLTYDLLITVEEPLEILGLITFIYALLSYISIRYGGVTIRLAKR